MILIITLVKYVGSELIVLIVPYFQQLKQAGFICARKGAFHSYNGNLGFDCCIQTSAEEWTALSVANPVLISWTCPECDLTVAPEHSTCQGADCIATGHPPTRQACLERLFLKVEQLTAMLDHIPDRPATEADFAVATPSNTLALLLGPNK